MKSKFPPTPDTQALPQGRRCQRFLVCPTIKNTRTHGRAHLQAPAQPGCALRWQRAPRRAGLVLL